MIYLMTTTKCSICHLWQYQISTQNACTIFMLCFIDPGFLGSRQNSTELIIDASLPAVYCSGGAAWSSEVHKPQLMLAQVV